MDWKEQKWKEAVTQELIDLVDLGELEVEDFEDSMAQVNETLKKPVNDNEVIHE